MKSLPEVFRKITAFLNKEQYDYLLIGGIAVGALGDPRMTQDIDFCLFVSKARIKNLLKKAKDAGFGFQEKEVSSRIRETGTFQIRCGSYHIDFLIASTDFEKTALRRRQRLKVYGTDAYFPTAEDMILFKIIAVLISVIASEAKQSLATGLLRHFVPRNDTLKIESRNSVSVRDNVII